MGYDLSNSRRWIVPHGGEPREVLRVENAAGVILWEKYYRVSYDANIGDNVITVVDAALEESIPAGTIDRQSKSYGYMVWTGSDLPVWTAGVADVFGSESRLGQGLQSRSVTAKGYAGQSRTTTAGGCGGITLKNILPSSGKLYTKVKLSPYIGVYVVSENGGSIENNNWYYTDRGISNDPAMNISGRLTVTGRSYYSRGKYFSVKMTVEDSVGTHVFSVSEQAPSALNGWSKTALSPTVLTFDFASQLESAGLRKDAKTTKIEFFEGTTSSPTWPAAVNAVCLYADTLN